MTTRERVIQAVRDFPGDTSLEDATRWLLLLARVGRGLRQADAGQWIDHRKVKERPAKWVT
jgi:predicted transcriptional regulator